VLVGGGLSSVPRIARELGVFVPKEQANEILGAVTTVWSEDLKYRMSRVKARLKFMVDDIGPEGLRERVEARLGRTFERYELPTLPRAANHLGVHPQRDGRSYVGVPVHLGLVNGDQMIELAELAGRLGGDVRLTRQQNLVLTNVADAELPATLEALAAIGLPVDAGPLQGDAIACTGEPHCNFSVTETKGRMDGLVRLLEERFGHEAEGLRLHLDGCPHACAQHWVGDLGFQGTTVRDELGERHQAYDVFLRGGLDRPVTIGRPVFRRVPTAELDGVVVGLVAGWVADRAEGEDFRSFCDRRTDDDLGRLAGREPVRAKEAVAS
jgi:ferredoxin-nitrite reductase